MAHLPTAGHALRRASRVGRLVTQDGLGEGNEVFIGIEVADEGAAFASAVEGILKAVRAILPEEARRARRHRRSKAYFR